VHLICSYYNKEKNPITLTKSLKTHSHRSVQTETLLWLIQLLWCCVCVCVCTTLTDIILFFMCCGVNMVNHKHTWSALASTQAEPHICHCLCVHERWQTWAVSTLPVALSRSTHLRQTGCEQYTLKELSHLL